jgi:hypothetical protein
MRHQEFERPYPGAKSPRLVAVAVSGARRAAFVGGCSYVLGHLGLKDLLHHPLRYLAQEARIIQQDLLRVPASTLR